MSTTSDAARISTRAGATPPGRCGAIASGRPDEQDVDVAFLDRSERARDDLTRRPIAPHRVDRDHGRQ